VLDGSGTIKISATGSEGAPAEERTLKIECPGAYRLIEHERHTQGLLTLEVGSGVECLATCFTPGVA
jgi:hypothetical protein